MNSNEQLSDDVLDKITNDKALSYIVDHLKEASEFDRTTLARFKKMELEEGLRTQVSSDEWLSASLASLMDDRMLGYTPECLSALFGTDRATVLRLVDRPSEVPLAERYRIIGQVARFSLLLNR